MKPITAFAITDNATTRPRRFRSLGVISTFPPRVLVANRQQAECQVRTWTFKLFRTSWRVIESTKNLFPSMRAASIGLNDHWQAQEKTPVSPGCASVLEFVQMKLPERNPLTEILRFGSLEDHVCAQ
jgi:hypothetical protein